MRKAILFLMLITLALTVGKFVQAQKMQDKEHGGRPLTATLTGAAEVPGPGDSDGGGTAKFTLNHGKGEVCYDLAVTNVTAPTAAHIHAGVAGQSGGVKVALQAPTDGAAKGCVNVDKELIKDMMQNPANYYVNVHNAEFPQGAVRGQLGK
jgi:hypothetical protein